MEKNNKGPFSLLLKVWLIVSTFTNVVALASLTDGLIAWSEFVREMIVSYAGIRDALWGSFFGFFKISVPIWTHDYLTINSIFAVSILWAMIDGAQSISSSKLNSAFLYFKNSVLDFTVGAQTPMYFAREAEEALAGAGLEPNPELSGKLSELARPIVSVFTVSKSLFMGIVIGASYFSFAFLFPWLVQANDRWDARLAAFEFRRVESKLRQIPWSPAQLDIVMTAFRSRVDQFAAFAAMDDLFHETVQRSLVKYLVSVAVLFLMLVFANQILTSML